MCRLEATHELVEGMQDLLGESLQGQLGEAQERYLAKVRAEVGRIGRVLAASAAGAPPASDENDAGDAVRAALLHDFQQLARDRFLVRIQGVDQPQFLRRILLER